MRALIFNSGVGNRMGEFTRAAHKCMARLGNGETIFARQLRLLARHGVSDVVVTTGPFADQLRAEAGRPEFSGLAITFVDNPVHDRTNYIHSLHLAAPHLAGDILMLHGDLVFDADLLGVVLADPRPDLALYNPELPQPDKDFKVLASGGRLIRVATTISGAHCHAFQPLYKLSSRALGVWLDEVGRFIKAGRDQVYAEDALNEVAGRAGIELLSYAGHFVAEVDTPEDLAEVSAEVRLWDFRQQPVVAEARAYVRLGPALAGLGVRRPLLVCGRSYDAQEVKGYIEALDIEPVRFDQFSPNPTYQQVVAGTELFRERACDGIISIGGGSAIDVAKTIKLFSALDPAADYLGQDFAYSPVPHLALPTTAGTGSESTHFSVVYVDGRKHSVAHDSMLPDQAFLDPTLLASLPDYQRKATLLDALCQCIESLWAAAATAESQAYATRGIQRILRRAFDYLRGDDPQAALEIAQAANLSGRAINLSKTTAPHAMSYALSARYGIAHGHAVALCLAPVWRYWTGHATELADVPSVTRFRRAEDALCQVFRVDSPRQAIARFDAFVELLGLGRPQATATELDDLASSVNAERLANSPLPLEPEAARGCYAEALAESGPALDSERTGEYRTLVVFDDFCRRYRLPYFLAGRTLLDAVVLGRLTPWSGQVTVWMPRKGFAKLQRWQDQLPPGHRLEDDGEHVRYVCTDETGPAGGIAIRVLESLNAGSAPTQGLRWGAVAVLHRLAAVRAGSRRPAGLVGRLGRSLDPAALRRLRRLAFARSERSPGDRLYVDPGLRGSFGKSWFPADWFEPGETVRLAGHEFRAPLHATSVLTRLYGRRHDTAWAIPNDAAARAAGRPRLAPEREPVDTATPPAGPGTTPGISVIVPVYNVEKYLRQCLDSLCHQDTGGYEVIAVDDGSPDGCAEILQEYAERYPELVRVLTRPNGGLSDARNAGLAQARGEYVAFVDADDFVAPTMIRLLGEKARRTDADIVVCRHSEYHDGTGRAETRWMSHLNSYGHSVRERPELLIAAHPYAWNKLYRRRLFTDHQIGYPRGQAFEDSATTFNLMLEANRIEVVTEPLYFYRVSRADSITGTFDRRFFDIFKSFDSIRGYYAAAGVQDHFREEIAELMRRTAFARMGALEACRDPEGVEEFLDAIYDYLERYAPDWAQNKYFRRQMENPKYRYSEKYRSMPNRQRMKAYFTQLWRNAGDDLRAAAATHSTAELIRMLQLEELDILLELDRVCRELGLTYYLAEGTLLGAIRHQGFIPWDDDVDIAMPRPDYERLLDHLAAGREPALRLFHERTYPRYHLTFAKVLATAGSGFTNSKVTVPPEYQGPTVDVFPLDVAVRARDRRVERRVRRLRDMLLFKVDFMSRRTRRAKFGVYVASKFRTFGGLQRQIQRLYRRYEGAPDADHIANFASSYPPDREKVPAAAYGEPRRVSFEGHPLPVPSDWDTVLRTTYGTYLQLPPPDRQVPRHRPRWRAPGSTAEADED